MRVGRTGGSAQIPDRSCGVGVHGEAHVHVVHAGLGKEAERLDRQGGIFSVLIGLIGWSGSSGSNGVDAVIPCMARLTRNCCAPDPAQSCPLLGHPLLGVDHGGLGREAEKGIPFCSTMCGLNVRGPRVAPDGGSVKLLLEKYQLVLLADLFLYC